MREHEQPITDLKGFDDYEFSLGDELRGERATRGKSLLMPNAICISKQPILLRLRIAIRPCFPIRAL